MNASDSSESLWSFALAFYAKKAIAETCLLLQDQHKVNVCLLIGLHWLDTKGCTLSTPDLADLSIYTVKWSREIIEPLRGLRRTLKQDFESYKKDELQEELRNSIKRAELLAEKKLLIEIEHWSTHIRTTNSTSNDSNLARYLTNLGLEKIFIDSIMQKLMSE